MDHSTCTQRWVGNELQYEDFPTPEGRMTRDQMMQVLERVSRLHPNDEFRGHNTNRGLHDPSGVRAEGEGFSVLSL
jgi:hypothetical protein